MSAYRPVLIDSFFEEHFEEAAWLWHLRSAAVNSSLCSLRHLADMDERIEAHIGGLRIAGDAAWALASEGIDPDEPGTLFTAAVLAFESHNADRMKTVVGHAGDSEAAEKELLSALGWLHNRHFYRFIKDMVRSDSPDIQRLGLAACGLRRLDPKGHLKSAIRNPDTALSAAALRTAGEVKRTDLLPQVRERLQEDDDACRFEAARTCLLLGDRAADKPLYAFAHNWSNHTLPALRLVLRIADHGHAMGFIKHLSKNAERKREVLISAGATGDAGLLPALIQQMETPEFARAAACAFATITGVDLVHEELEGDWPEGFESGPNDDPADEDVTMDPDRDLPWPDPDKLRHWLNSNKGSFPAGTRYICGLPVNPENCHKVLDTGNQAARYSAALELALSSPQTPWFNTRAPGGWQLDNLHTALPKQG